MALVKLTFKNAPRTKIDTIEIDALKSENLTLQNTVTQYPTEAGKKISDNIIVEPKQLSLDCLISDYPILKGKEFDPGLGRRSLVAYFDLWQLRDNKVIFSVQTGLDLYENMAIANFRPTRNSSNTNALEFTIDLVEVLKVSASTVIIPKEQIKEPPTEAKDQAQSTVNKGSQQTTPADTKPSSFAKMLWDTIFK